MDIDSIFKVPKLPGGAANKRKLPDNPSPELLKKMRLDAESLNEDARMTNASQQPSGSSRRRVVEMEEVGDEDRNEHEQSFAPGGDADYFAEEDDEGRFFGGGLTSEQKEILNIFDNATTDETDLGDFSISKIRKLLLNFERAVNKNQDQRSKYPNDPSKFIDSEADLDSAIKALMPLSQTPTLAYSELVRSGTVVLLVGLLTHENIDIVIDVVDLVFEFTDEDAGDDLDEDKHEQQESLKLLVDSLVDNAALELFVDNLSRFNESDESDRQGVFRTLGIFENVVAFEPNLASSLFSKTKILVWLLKRIQVKQHDENRSYAAELLSIFLQTSPENRNHFGAAEGVEITLQVLSQFRRRDPVDADETEFMDNLFDSLCSALHEPKVKNSFLDTEGTDLMVLMMKEKKASQTRAIKVLDHALSGTSGEGISNAFVEALGLKTLFSIFLGKTTKKQKSGSEAIITPQDASHILSVISSLFRHLPSDSSNRIRLLAKFVENNYEKVDKVLEIRDSASKRLTTTDAEIAVEKQDIMDTEGEEGVAELEELIYLRRLDGGLFTLQTVDYILAWLMIEDDGIQAHITRMLGRKNKSMSDIRETLEYYYDHIDDEAQQADTISQKDILASLITALSTDSTTS